MADFILSQSLSFLAFFCCGICAAVLFDLFRIFRKLVTHSNIAIHFEDLCFWLFTGVFLFLLLFIFQSGKLRIFLIPSFLLGAGLWNISFGRFFRGPLLRFFLFLKNKLTRLLRRRKNFT